MTHASPARLAGLLADYFLHAVRHGYSLRPQTLAQRSQRHFDGAASLVRRTATALAEWILASDAFAYFVDSYEQSILNWADDADGSEAIHPADSMPPDWLFWAGEAAMAQWFAGQGGAPTYEPPFSAIAALPSSGAESYSALKSHIILLPLLRDADDLAKLLEISREELDDAMRAPRYRLRTVEKASGNLRILEIPPEPLRVVQRRLLHRVLDQVRPHDAAHGFVRGRSVHTHAASHVSRALVIRLDLAEFFPSIRGSSVFLLFRALGYDVHMANLLTAIAVTQQSRPALRAAMRGASFDQVAAATERFGVNHLPQGAPSSPAIANLCAFALDVRLHAWATAFGASYTRYADDLVFSGDAAFAARYREFIITARAIIAAAGWRLNTQKTRVMRAAVVPVPQSLQVSKKPRKSVHSASMSDFFASCAIKAMR